MEKIPHLRRGQTVTSLSIFAQAFCATHEAFPASTSLNQKNILFLFSVDVVIREHDEMMKFLLF